jgi:hypothetical protein
LRIAGALLIAVMALVSCAGARERSAFIVPGHPLEIRLAESVRAGKIYHGFDTALIVDVVYNGASLREAWVEARAERERMSMEEKAALLDSQRKEDAQAAVFYVAMYTSFEDWGAPGDGNAKWAVRARTPSGLAYPSNVEKVKPEKLPWRERLPFDPRFRTFYRLSFPRETVGATPTSLLVSCEFGEVRLDWDRR